MEVMYKYSLCVYVLLVFGVRDKRLFPTSNFQFFLIH